jgi:hypothetical protein
MNPTIAEPALMEVVPYTHEAAVRPGDVLLFQPPGQPSAIVHRAMRITPRGILTRGDNNPMDDAAPLAFAHVTGRVVAIRRGEQRRTIHGGRAGLAWHYFLRGWRVINRWLSRLLHAPYHALARTGLLRRLLPARWRPRVVVFQGARLVMLGARVIGRYDARTRAWQIRRPLRLLCDPQDLTND